MPSPQSTRDVQALEDAVAAVVVDGEGLDAGAAAEELARGARDEDGAVVLCVRVERGDLLGRAPEGLRCVQRRVLYASRDGVSRVRSI